MESNKSSEKNRIRDALSRIYEEQSPQMREYLKRYQENPKSRVFAPLAEAYRRQGKVEEAIRICQEGLVHHPEFHGGRVALAKCYIDVNRNTEAIAELETVVAKVAENILALKLLGDAYSKTEDRVRAVHFWKMALLQAPQDNDLAKKIETGESELALARSQTPFEHPVQVEVPIQRQGFQVQSEIENVEEEKSDFLVPSISSDGRLEMIPFVAEDADSAIDKILGFESQADDADLFRVEHVSQIFSEESTNPEISTSTLGDLYFAQGQYERALRIFEKLLVKSNSPDLKQKMDLCRVRMGVPENELARKQKIDLLSGLLDRVRAPQ